MSFDEACAYLDDLGVDAMKTMTPSMHRIEAMCDALNHPERAVPAIHVTGTNGKTTTASVATSLLVATGLSVATYTSPHLQRVTERISLSGEPLSADAFGAVFDHIRPYLEMVEARLKEKLTFFEVLTSMFYLWAAETPVDASVVEVGLGGRWDATNVITAPVAVITNVGFDHMGLLGNDKASIAREKAGIIKRDSVVVTAERSPDVLAIIESQADAVGARTSVIGREFEVLENRVAVGGRYLSLRNGEQRYDEVFLPLNGAHQGVNAATALQAAASFLPARTLDRWVVEEGFSGVAVPGRIEPVKTRSAAPVVLDVAHNPEGVSALVNSLVEGFAFDHATFVIGILGDKDYKGMLSELTRVPSSVIVTEPKNVRSVPVDELQSEAKGLGLRCEAIDDVATAVDVAIGAAAPGDLVCITGSHYVVGEARSHLVDIKNGSSARTASEEAWPRPRERSSSSSPTRSEGS